MDDCISLVFANVAADDDADDEDDDDDDDDDDGDDDDDDDDDGDDDDDYINFILKSTTTMARTASTVTKQHLVKCNLNNANVKYPYHILGDL